MSAIFQDSVRYDGETGKSPFGSWLGTLSLILALVVAVGVLFELGLAVYLARDLPAPMWHPLTALNVDIALKPVQNKHLKEVVFIWRENLWHILLPAQALTLLLGALSVMTTTRSKRPGTLAIIVSLAVIVLVALVLIFRFSAGLLIPGLS